MRRPGPSTIERIRSLAATATPTSAALADDPATRFSACGAVDHAGRAVLVLDADHPLREALRRPRPGHADLAVGLEISALRHVGHISTVRARMWWEGTIAPVPTRERREAALAVWERHPSEELLTAVDNDPTAVDPDMPLLARVEPDLVFYDAYDEAGVIEGAAFRRARPDPLLPAAERILSQVNDRHRDDLSAALSHLPGVPEGAAWVWDLDSHGVTLWVAPYDASQPAVVRVPWNVPATAACELERALHHLIAHREATDRANP
ncbi:DUF2470 domain-containing protein [Salinactinospora qingdaonensis]|uniref:DUF2470 domain-containing protein n=1 Tax=Salinactinospora qingdaonensis TaxID=702744 RepID=A0ABP7FCE0_9ACTN